MTVSAFKPVRADLSPKSGTVPRHVAIIMDGNGRWAKARHLPRVAGHRAGAQAVRRAVESAISAGVEWLTLYAFSSENWRRPGEEVADLTGLLRHYLRTEVAELHRERVRLRSIGDRARFGPEINRELADAEALTRGNCPPQPDHRPELRRARRNRRRRTCALAEAAAAGRLDPAVHHRSQLRRVSLHRRNPRPRPGDPHQRRTPRLQLPALAIGLRGIPVPRSPVARFQPGAFRKRARRFRPAGAPLWCPSWLSKRPPHPQRARWRDLTPRVASILVMAPLGLATIFAGGWVWQVVLTALCMIAMLEWASILRRASADRAGAHRRDHPADRLGLPSSRWRDWGMAALPSHAPGRVGRRCGAVRGRGPGGVLDHPDKPLHRPWHGLCRLSAGRPC